MSNRTGSILIVDDHPANVLTLNDTLVAIGSARYWLDFAT